MPSGTPARSAFSPNQGQQALHFLAQLGFDLVGGAHDSALCLLALTCTVAPSSAMIPNFRHLISRASMSTCTNRAFTCGRKRHLKLAIVSWSGWVLAATNRNATESYVAEAG
jgi:hypothetical protein